MSNVMDIKAVKTPVIKPGDDIVKIFLESLEECNITLQEQDIIAVGEKIIATAQGRIVDLETITDISDQATQIGIKYKIDPRKVQVIMGESEEILGGVDTVLLTRSYGLLLANAGIDSSNSSDNAMEDTSVILFPSDLWGTIRKFRADLEEASSICPLGSLLIDSRVQPLKVGIIGGALAVSGFQPIEDLRGQKDIFGRPLLIKQMALADDLSSAAEIMMREAAEQTPFVVIHDAPVQFCDDAAILEDSMLMPMDQDLFMNVFKNYKKDKVLLQK
ncbi:MAG TPA: coenzyme F420-0:L-glutamate ligase [Candidatus Lokiarchaeia archaeon]|nr:coenzyme F420-0:L-glutamate ligase [Candidatus Lokiarchaeia archaeon]